MAYVYYILPSRKIRRTDPAKGLGNTPSDVVASHCFWKYFHRYHNNHRPAGSTTNPERERRALVDSWERHGLDGEPFPALRAPSRQDIPSGFALHASKEAVLTLTLYFFGSVSSYLHSQQAMYYV